MKINISGFEEHVEIYNISVKGLLCKYRIPNPSPVSLYIQYIVITLSITFTIHIIHGIRAKKILRPKFFLAAKHIFTMTDTTTTIQVDNKTLFTINVTNVTKLNQTNYLLWKLQIHALVEGYGLPGHLDGSTVVPSPTHTADGVTTSNPDFTLWK